MHYDFIVIGSGFGGSVSALRLAEKGYKTAVVEQGGWVGSNDFEAAKKKPSRLLWMPPLGMRGYFYQEFYKHIAIIGGVGVGGGSIVYAAVLLEPKDDFYNDGAWSNLGVNWKREMAPHYKTASKMLGVEKNPASDIQDEYLKKTALKMKAGTTFGKVPNGIYFGKPEVMKKDPYFKGDGPDRTGCHLCGECLTGCPHNSKNTLDKNYLYLAQKKGVEILTNRKVVNIIPRQKGGYHIQMRDPLKKKIRYPDISADNIVLAGGVLGTLELLFRCKQVTKTLPDISDQLGKLVRTNSEAIVYILDKNDEIDLTKGTAISTEFYPDKKTHITQNRFGEAYNFTKIYAGPLVDDDSPARRFRRVLKELIFHPVRSTRVMRSKNFYKRITALTVMQHADNNMAFTFGRSIMNNFDYRLKSKKSKGEHIPTNLEVANLAAAAYAEVSGGIPSNLLSESMLNIGTTAHILGGCHIGKDRESGVIDTEHRLFGYEGIYVVDASAITANVGVNPSLTITALSERALSKIPKKNG